MEQLTDYYSVLGVDANAPAEVIKKEFKHLAHQYHPDVYKGEDAEKRMREILLAYHTLIDPESRRTYDLSRSKHVPGSSVRAENTTDVSPAARHDRQRYFAFPHSTMMCQHKSTWARSPICFLPVRYAG